MSKEYVIKMATVAAKSLNINVKVIPEDEGFIEFDGWVYVQPSKISIIRHNILGDTVDRVGGWVVSAVDAIPGSYWEPEDYDVTELSEHVTAIDAISDALQVIVKDRIVKSICYLGECIENSDTCESC